MGIVNDKLVVLIANATKNCKSNKKQLILSSVSLFMAVIILATTTVCWFCLQEADTTGTFNVDAGNGLRLNYNNDNSSVVEIKENMAFKPLSSVMGQNLYFPSDGSFFTKDTAEKKVSILEHTNEITYRSATAGDKNVFFLQYDFSLTSFADDTEVFMDAENTFIREKVNNPENSENPELQGDPINAMRVAFIYDNGKGSVVMNPTDSDRTVEAVEVANYGTGECISTAPQVSHPFKYYTADRGNSLFKMKAGENQKISVVIWLEGTDPECIDSIQGKFVDINIKFTTTWNDMDTIEFVDKSSDGWIEKFINEKSQLQLIYEEPLGSTKIYDLKVTYDETTGTNKYVCRIPKSVDSGLSFKLTHNGKEYIWNKEPDGTSSQYRAKNTTYYAKGTKGDPEKGIEADPRGYWKYSGSEGDNDVPVDTFPDLDW